MFILPGMFLYDLEGKMRKYSSPHIFFFLIPAVSSGLGQQKGRVEAGLPTRDEGRLQASFWLIATAPLANTDGGATSPV